MKFHSRALAIAVAMTTAAIAQTAPSTRPTEAQIDARVDALVAQMTPEEKLSLVHADSKFSTAGVPRLGIPKRWLSDGPHGVREDVGPFSWNPANRTDDFITAMPSDLCLAASFDPDLARRYGEVIGDEARARGKDIMLGPSVNIHRSPLNGRNFEYMSEDPFLSAQTAVGYIRGLQSRDVSACVKHFAMNNEEVDRNSVNVLADDRTMREIYLPAFEAAVKQGGVLSVMGAYNKFRGQFCCQNDLLLNKILKGEWGFKGLVVSDWGGVHDTREAALNGMDLEMGSDGPQRTYDQFFLAKPYLNLIQSGAIPMSTLDDKAKRNLYVAVKTMMLDPANRAPGSMNTKAHQQTARDVAEAGMVLLKNDGNTLPLDPAKPPSLAVIGDFATRAQAHGGGSAELKSFYEITPLEGIVARVGQAANVTFSQGFRPVEAGRGRRPTTQPQFDAAGMPIAGATTTVPIDPTMQPDEALIARAVAAAKSADVAIVVAGTGHNRFFDTEGSDRKSLELPYGQNELIARVVAANPKTIVVLLGGGPVDMPWLDRVPAVLEMWYGGLEAGNALARTLFGDSNPSGKLPCTFPKKLADIPAHALDAWPGKNNVVDYKEGLFVGYRGFDQNNVEPLFPFGYGLSYTTFDVANLHVTPNDSAGGPSAVAECDVTNTGQRAGSQVVQVYVHQDSPSLPRPPQELKGFAKVNLKPGETKRVSIPLPPRSFAFFDPAKQSWVVEAGTFQIRVGFSSREIKLKEPFTVKTTATLK